MKDQTVRGPSTEPVHAQCVDNQLPGHALAHREPDHLTAEQVDDDREIKPSFLCPHIGDVASPNPIWRLDCKPAFQKVRRDGKAMRTIRRRLEFTLSMATKTMDLHQLSHALFASMNATRRKLTPDTWPAIGALHLIENRLEVNQKGHITDPAAGLQWTSSSRLPRSMLAIAAGADFEHLALPRYWPDRSMSLDKGVSHRDYRLILEFQRVPRPNQSCHLKPSKADPTQSALRTFFGGKIRERRLSCAALYRY